MSHDANVSPHPLTSSADIESALTVARLRSRLFGISSQPTFGPGGRYIILDRRGTGGMANVYKAQDTHLGITVALKLLRTDPWHAGSRLVSAGERLMKEAQRLAATRATRHVAAVYDAARHDGAHYISMEHIDGPNLRRWQTDRRRTQAEILAAYLEAGRGLAELHRAGLVHLDFKPENVVIEEHSDAASAGKPWRAVIVDLGLAMRTGEREPAGDEPLAYTLYTAGGTPAYTAPERLSQRSVGPAADQFSFCVALYEALYGSHPFIGLPPLEEYVSTMRSEQPRLAESTVRLKYVHDVQAAIRRGRLAPRARELRLPWRMLAALERGMHPDPARRFASMSELLAALTWSQRQRARIFRVLLPLVASVALVGGGAWAIERIYQCTGFDASVQSLWNPAVAERVRESFAGAPVAGSVVAAFDEFAERWQTSSASACDAHRRGRQSERAYDQRGACMNHALAVARKVLRGLTDGFETERVGPVQLTLLGELLAACEDERPGDPPLVVDLADAGLLSELTDLVAMEVLGALASARVRAEALLVRAEAVGDPGLTAEVAHRLGRILGQMRTDPRQGPELLAAADRALARAIDEAAAAERGRLLLDAWIFRLKLRAETIATPASAAQHFPEGPDRLAEAASSARLFGSTAQQAEIAEAQGLYALRVRDPTAAIASLQTALVLRRDAPDDALRFSQIVPLAKTLGNLAAAYVLDAADPSTGLDQETALAEARARYDEAIALWTRATDPRSFYTLRARMNRASVLRDQGDDEGARAELAEVRRLLAELDALDPHARERGLAEWNTMHLHLARQAYDDGELDASEALVRTLLAGPLFPAHAAQADFLQAEICVQRQDWSCAERNANAVIALDDPDNSRAARELLAEIAEQRSTPP